jgi:hypothetical protein
VTAGSSPTLVTTRESSVFISVDLPTFGIPRIIIRSGLSGELRVGASALACSGMRFTAFACLALRATAFTPGWAL